jgi:predicted nucleic acid-binding protein
MPNTAMARHSAYLDANAIIHVVEQRSGIPVAALSDLARLIDLHTSEISLHEVLVLPMRRGDGAAVEAFHALFDLPDVMSVHQASRRILVRAAELRADRPMQMADAIHVATADLAGCDVILSHDRKLHLPQAIDRVPPEAEALNEWLSRL